MADGPPKFVATTSLSDAQEYVTAARLLCASQHDRVKSPLYFVISQALELFLKAYIVARSRSTELVQGRHIQHNLNELLSMAEQRGFDLCSSEARDLITVLHPLHKTHYFRYRNINRAEWPSVRVAVNTLTQFESVISPLISKAIDADGGKIGVSE